MTYNFRSMKCLVLVLAFGVCGLSAQPPERREKDKFSGEFILTLAKGEKLDENSSLDKKYRVLIDDGELTVITIEEEEEDKAGGSMTLTIRDGVDVVKEAPIAPYGCLRIEKYTGGWANDIFVTRMDLHFKGRQKPDGTWVPVFNKTATLEFLWLDHLENGMTRYKDVMGVHTKAVYDVEVVVNPMNR